MYYLVGQVVQLNTFIISFPFILEDASEAVGPNISNLPFLCKENNYLVPTLPGIECLVFLSLLVESNFGSFASTVADGAEMR